MPIFLGLLFLVICVLLTVVILLQKGRGVGLAGMLGGGSSHSAFGTRTGDVFTWVTIVLVAVFLLLAVVSTWVFRPEQQAVEDVTATPPPQQPIARPILVSLGTHTPKADIHYTVDGSDPDKGSLKYDAPIRIAPGTVLKARAYYTGRSPSKILVARYERLGAATQTAPAATGAAATMAPKPDASGLGTPTSTAPAATRPAAEAPRPAARPATGAAR